MNSRRLIVIPGAKDRPSYQSKPELWKGFPNVRFGSKADIRAAKSDVRFTLDSDRKSEFPHKVMSALAPKADMCSALAYVCFGPKADMALIR
jgi:hypothetical protein